MVRDGINGFDGMVVLAVMLTFTLGVGFVLGWIMS